MTYHIKQILNSVVQSDTNWKLKLLRQWKNIVGSKLSSKVTIEKIYNDTIVLGVYDSCWMQELYLLSPILLKTINQNLDQPHIKKVRFKTTVRKKIAPKNIKTKSTTRSITIKLTARAKQALEAIPDEMLRAALKAFYIRCARERICKK